MSKLQKTHYTVFDYEIPNLKEHKINAIGATDMVILSGGTQLGVFCLLVVEFHRGGSASNKATLFRL